MTRFAIAALLFASSLGAQATSQQRIPVRKTKAAPGVVDTIVLRRIDTVVVRKVDTVYVGAAAPLTTVDSLFRADTSTCDRGFLPIPIPLPIDHHSPAATVPEPATIWLVGTALIVIGFAWGRRYRRRPDEV